MAQLKQRPGEQSAVPLWVIVLIYAVLVATFFVVRYGGRWMDTDTPVLSRAIANVAQEGTLVPDGPIYHMGFAYQSLSVALLQVTGVSVDVLQRVVYPLIAGVMVATVAFVLFRELTGDARVAALAALVLFMQPDFLFVIFRGSHEKLTWTLTMLLLYLAFRSFRCQPTFKQLMPYVGAFYVTVMALAATNIFFASSFVSSIVLSCVGGYVVLTLRRLVFRQPAPQAVALEQLLLRFLYVALSSFVILALVLFYVYPPAQLFIFSLQSLAEKLAIVLGGYEYASNPYQIVGFGWISPLTYFSLTVLNWLVLLISLLTWLFMLPVASVRNPRRFMFWLLYAAFAFHIGIGMVADLAGLLGTNLQLRLFPAFTLVAIPMALLGVRHLLRARLTGRLRQGVVVALLLTLPWFSGAALLKMTNEPLLSNYWTFYTETEVAALRWSYVYLEGAKLWADLDAIRLKPLSLTLAAEERPLGDEVLRLDVGTVDVDTRDFMISEPLQLWSARNAQMLPDVAMEHRVYDNGDVVIYHRRPRTPYQK